MTEYKYKIVMALRDDGPDTPVVFNGQPLTRTSAAGVLSRSLTEQDPDLYSWSSVQPVWTDNDAKAYRVMATSMRQSDVDQMPMFLALLTQDADALVVSPDSTEATASKNDGELLGWYSVKLVSESSTQDNIDALMTKGLARTERIKEL